MEDLHRRIKTFMLILIWVSMGLYIEVGGPTMMDLKLHFDADYEGVARSVSAQGVGVFFGAVMAGFTVDALGKWKDLIITVSQILTLIATLSMPFVGNLDLLWLMFFVNGTAAGAVNVAGQRILLEMWQDKSASPMHAIHMGFGIGALVAPLIANKFLAVLKFGNSPGDFESLNITANQSHHTTENGIPFLVVEETRVQYAFVAIGVGAALLAIPFFIYPFYTCWASRQRDNIKEIEETKISCSRLASFFNPATYTKGSMSFGITMFIIIFAVYSNLVGSEQLYGNFVRTFSVDQLNFERNEASYLDTAYWASFTLGRFVGSVMSHFVPIKMLLIIDILLNVLAVTLLDIFSTNSHAMLWIFTILVGFTIAPLFPAFISYINTYMEVGGIVLTLVVVASGLGHLFYIWVAGVLYDKYGPRMLLYAMQVSAIIVMMICAILICFTIKRKNRYAKTVADTLFPSDSMQEVSYSRLQDQEE